MSLRTLASRASVAILAASWILNPRYFGYFGSEGLFRWGALLACAVSALLLTPTSFYRTKLFWAFCGVLLAAGLSIVAAGLSRDSIADFVRMALLITVVPLVMQGARTTRGIQDDFLLILTATVVASLALHFVDSRATVSGRLLGITAHPNDLALLAAASAIIPPVVPLAPIRGFAFTLRFVASVWVVVLTESLMGILIVVGWYVAHLLSAMLTATVLRREKYSLTVFYVLSVLATVMILAPLPIALLDSEVAFTLFHMDESSYIRYRLWSGAISVFSEYPLTGSGFGTTQYGYSIRGVEGEYGYSHSVILNYLSTTGMIGLTAIVCLIFSVSRIVGQHPVEKTLSDRKRLVSALFFSVLMFSSMEAGLQQMPLSWIVLWLCVGLALSAQSTEVATVTRQSGLPQAALA